MHLYDGPLWTSSLHWFLCMWSFSEWCIEIVYCLGHFCYDILLCAIHVLKCLCVCVLLYTLFSLMWISIEPFVKEILFEITKKEGKKCCNRLFTKSQLLVPGPDEMKMNTRTLNYSYSQLALYYNTVQVDFQRCMSMIRLSLVPLQFVSVQNINGKSSLKG